ncbi:MAG: HAMP domain-containing protein [Deferribacteres bacterium]|nr:HAMP domain-containing protein [candidate division KSB1 bacterium]MCB9512521.1 HAMP domain-containing protein [Deferribacteres bacterium]
MDLLFFKRRTLFRRLFFITLIVAVSPLVVTWLYYLRELSRAGISMQDSLSLPLFGFLAFSILLSTIGAYYLSKKISRPIGHFTRSATEIARGNFEQTIDIKTNDELGRLAKIFNYMTTELRRLNEMNLNQIIREKNKTTTIIRNIIDGVIVTDPQYRILIVNNVAENLFGISEKQALNKPIEQIIHNKQLLDFLYAISKEGDGGTTTREIKLKNPDTWRDIYLQARAARVAGEGDEIVGIVTIIRDITREKEIDKMKTELVSMVAHELRSPLTSISGFSELLLDEGVTKEQSEEYAAIILKESNRLSELINKFLDISKIEAGKSQVKKSPVQLREILDKVLDVNLHQAERKNIAVSVRVSNNLPVILGDRDMIEQVVLNLFSNSIKYSPENSAVEVRLREVDGEIVTEIEDNGYGISAESLPRIFDKFYRAADNEAVREISGTGLGLSLVKEIVELHGGRVTVKSTLGKGSTFGFILPSFESLPEASEQASIEVSMIEQ